jgi:D-aminoacyl-tRNA deacylase
MRAVIQRVTRGRVTVGDETVGQIERGLVVLLGIKTGDTEAEALWLAQKIANLRIFEDEEGKFNRSLLEVGGGALVVSQFTLYGDARRGRRPSFSDAAAPEVAAPLVERVGAWLREQGVQRVEMGRFQARMRVEIHNDGPVTIILDTDVSRRGNLKA